MLITSAKSTRAHCAFHHGQEYCANERGYISIVYSCICVFGSRSPLNPFEVREFGVSPSGTTPGATFKTPQLIRIQASPCLPSHCATQGDTIHETKHRRLARQYLPPVSARLAYPNITWRAARQAPDLHQEFLHGLILSVVLNYAEITLSPHPTCPSSSPEPHLGPASTLPDHTSHDKIF